MREPSAMGSVAPTPTAAAVPEGGWLAADDRANRPTSNRTGPYNLLQCNYLNAVPFMPKTHYDLEKCLSHNYFSQPVGEETFHCDEGWIGLDDDTKQLWVYLAADAGSVNYRDLTGIDKITFNKAILKQVNDLLVF